jgi:hypothetical protein
MHYYVLIPKSEHTYSVIPIEVPYGFGCRSGTATFLTQDKWCLNVSLPGAKESDKGLLYIYDLASQEVLLTVNVGQGL